MRNKKIYTTDCEGPLTKDDNAYDVAKSFLSNGDRLFTLLSKFDDYLGYVEGIKGYRFGSTLLYIIPFLKAEGVKDEDLKRFSKRRITLMPGARDTIKEIKEIMDVYIISTSYRHYIEGVSEILETPMEKFFFTEVSFDQYSMAEEEKRIIKEYEKTFSELDEIFWDEEKRLSPSAQKSVEILKRFFFSELKQLPIYGWLKDIKVMGGEEKRLALLSIVKRERIDLKDLIYVGDSITDIEALDMVYKLGGLSISFNGNRYAVSSAEFLVVSKNADVLKDLVWQFKERGKERIKRGQVNEETFVFKKGDMDIEEITILSEKTRKEVRGEIVGALG